LKNYQGLILILFGSKKPSLYQQVLQQKDTLSKTGRTNKFFGIRKEETVIKRKKHYGTGSMPPGLKGWHLNIRLTAK